MPKEKEDKNSCSESLFQAHRSIRFLRFLIYALVVDNRTRTSNNFKAVVTKSC